jgi:hypothetical protein
MPDAILEARKRFEQSSVRDGLGEILTGIIVLQSIAGTQIIHLGNVPADILYILVQWAFVLSLPRILRAVRERLTYPRSGYVQELSRRRRQVIGVFSVTLATVVIFLILHTANHAGWVNSAEWEQWIPAVIGAGAGALEVYMSMRYGFRRFLVVAIFSTILGIVVSIEYAMPSSLTIWLTGFACATLCSGGFALLTYLKTPQLPASEV